MGMTEVYIAKITPLEDSERFASLLCSVREERRERIARLRMAADRRRSLAAELLLKHALSLRGIKQYSVSRGTYGKPCLDGIWGVYFNLSHAGEYAVCALSDTEIGCDVERIDPQVDLAIADRFFTFDEAAWIRAAQTEEEQTERFFRLWTLKESLMKATGKGFALSPRTFSFDLTGDAPILQSSPRELSRYVFREFSAIHGYRIALCTDGGAAAFTRLILTKIETLC